MSVIRTRIFPSILRFLRAFLMTECGILSKLFICNHHNCHVFFFSFSVLIENHIDFWIRSQRYIPGEKSHLVIMSIFFIYWIQLASILLRILISWGILRFFLFYCVCFFFFLSLNQGNTPRVNGEALPPLLFLKFFV